MVSRSIFCLPAAVYLGKLSPQALWLLIEFNQCEILKQNLKTKEDDTGLHSDVLKFPWVSMSRSSRRQVGIWLYLLSLWFRPTPTTFRFSHHSVLRMEITSEQLSSPCGSTTSTSRLYKSLQISPSGEMLLRVPSVCR